MLKISFAGCSDLSSGILSQFTLEKPEIAKKSLKPLFGCLKSFKIIDVDKIKKPVTSVCYDKQHVCANLQPFSH